MQYHALALAVNGSEVDLVGLEGAPLHAALTRESRLQVPSPWRSGVCVAPFSWSTTVRLDVGRARVDAGQPAARHADAVAQTRRHSGSEPAVDAHARGVVAGFAAAGRAARGRLAQPVAHHPRGATGRASSGGSCIGPQRASLGTARGWPSGRFQGVGRLAAARVEDQRHRALRSPGRVSRQTSARSQQRVVAAAGSRSSSRPAPHPARRVPYELDARRGLRLAARSTRACRAGAESRRTARAMGNRPTSRCC